MTPSWEKYKLRDLSRKIGSGATPRGGEASYFTQGISLIRSQNVLDFNFSNDGLARLDEEQARKLSNVIVEPEDVLINITGDSVARVCQVPDSVLPARVNQHVAIIRPHKTTLDPKFLKYYLLNPSFKSYMLSIAASGGTRKALTKGMIEDFEIFLPPIEYQSDIVEILSALDDKIELNLEMNKTLEEMAMVIYKEWFVDFGPFRNEEFVDSELGLIPRDWEVKNIGQLFSYVIGGDWGKEKPDVEHTKKTRIIRGTDIPTLESGGINGVPKRFIKEKNFIKRRLIDGDIIIEISGGSTGQPTGRSLYITQNYLNRLNNDVVPASFCRLLRPVSPIIGILLAVHLKYLYKTGGTWFYQNQSTGLSNFQFKFFSDTELLPIPNDIQILERFTDLFKPLYEKMSSNENLYLTETRDYLLPKLISGDIRVNMAENHLKEIL